MPIDRILIALLSAFLCVPHGLAQDVLDLVKAERERKPKPSSSQSGMGQLLVTAGATHVIPPTLPFEITLRSVTPRIARYGASFTYEIALRNIGPTEFKIPWSSEEIDASADSGPVGFALVSVWFRDEVNNSDQYMASMRVYGSAAVPASVKTLKPGEQVVIRAGGRLVLGGADDSARFEASLPKEVTLNASWGFAVTDFRDRALAYNPVLFSSPLPVVSTSSMTVRIQKASD